MPHVNVKFNNQKYEEKMLLAHEYYSGYHFCSLNFIAIYKTNILSIIKYQ